MHRWRRLWGSLAVVLMFLVGTGVVIAQSPTHRETVKWYFQRGIGLGTGLPQTPVVELQAPGSLSSSYTLTWPTGQSSGTQCLANNGSGTLSWTGCSGSATTPGGSDTQVQFNDGGIFGGDAGFVYNKTTNTATIDKINLGTAGSVLGSYTLSGNTSGTVTVQPAAAAGTWTLTVPTTAGTSGQFLQTNGSGVTTWASSSGAPASPDRAIQFNNAGSFGGSANFLFGTASNVTHTSTGIGGYGWVGESTYASADIGEVGYLEGVFLQGHAAGTATALYGVHGKVDNTTPTNGGATLAAGIAGTVTKDGTGTYATAAALAAKTNVRVAGTVTDNVGLLLESQAGVGTNNYQLLSKGTPDAHFYGPVRSGLAGTGTGAFKLSGTTSGTVTTTVAAAAGTWTFTLPTGAGSSGQVLQTDGVGVTSWVSNAPTASALAANPADCGVNTFATTIAANGDLTCATPALGTDTSGNYVVDVTAGAGLTKSSSAGEGQTVDLAVLSTEAGFLTDGGTTDLTCGASNQGKAQVLDNGEFQYCDGAATSVLHRGARFLYGLTQVGTTAVDRYLPINAASYDATEANVDTYRAPVAFTCKNLRVRVATAPGTGTSWAITLRSGAPGALANTSLTCTIADTNTTCDDLANTGAVAAGDAATWFLDATGTVTTNGGIAINAECFF